MFFFQNCGKIQLQSAGLSQDREATTFEPTADPVPISIGGSLTPPPNNVVSYKDCLNIISRNESLDAVPVTVILAQVFGPGSTGLRVEKGFITIGNKGLPAANATQVRSYAATIVDANTGYVSFTVPSHELSLGIYSSYFYGYGYGGLFPLCSP